MRRTPRLAILGALAILVAVAPAARAGVAADEEAWVEFTAYPGVSISPDTNTRVYQAVYAASPAYETVIRGIPPRARYWSFAILDPARREIANVTDEDVALGDDGRYEIIVRFGCDDAPACMDAGRSAAPGVPDRILYRIYVPEGDELGGVALPEVEYRASGDGETIAPPFPPGVVQDLIGSTAAPLRPDGAVHDGASQPTGVAQAVAQPGADPQPERFRGLGGAQEQQLADAGVPAPVIDVVHEARGQGGFGATEDNAYVTVAYASRFGDLVLTAKAPTYTRQSDAPANPLGRPRQGAQTRYWSMCTVQGSRPVDCVRDEHVPVDNRGRFTVLVAADCTRHPDQPGVLCLRMGAAGGSANGSLLYRNLLARPDFANDNGPHECPPGPSQFCGAHAIAGRYVARPPRASG